MSDVASEKPSPKKLPSKTHPRKPKYSALKKELTADAVSSFAPLEDEGPIPGNGALADAIKTADHPPLVPFSQAFLASVFVARPESSSSSKTEEKAEAEGDLNQRE